MCRAAECVELDTGSFGAPAIHRLQLCQLDVRALRRRYTLELFRPALMHGCEFIIGKFSAQLFSFLNHLVTLPRPFGKTIQYLRVSRPQFQTHALAERWR